MRTRLIAFGSLTPDDLASWGDLVRRASQPNPFYEPAMLRPAVRHLGSERVGLLVAQDTGGAWIGAVPVRRQSRLGRFPGPCTVNWIHPHCFLGTPLLAGNREEAAAAALLRTMRTRSAWAGLREIPADGPVATAFAAAGRAVAIEHRERAVADGGAAGSAALSPRARSDLRRRSRRLAEDLGAPVELCVAAGAGEDAERLLALEHGGWKREAGTSLLSHPEEAAFFRDAAAELGDRMHFFRLQAGERTAAVASSIAAGGEEFLFKTAYDERLSRHAPGLQLAVAAIDALRDRRGVDSCAAPDSGYVNDLLPGRRPIVTLAFPRVPGYGPLLRALAS